MENKPSYEPVLTHGDFCLPNILIKNGKLSGFIDLGKTGTGDRWMDIALCYRSLKHNADGTWSGKVYPDIRPEVLFEELGISRGVLRNENLAYQHFRTHYKSRTAH